MNFDILLDKIMMCDDYVRYATICDMNTEIVCRRKKDGIVNYLSEEKTKESLQYSVNSWKFRNNLSEKIGKGHYVLAVYDNLRRVTMPLGDRHLLLVTLDNNGGQSEIIGRIQAILNGDYTKPQKRGPQY